MVVIEKDLVDVFKDWMSIIEAAEWEDGNKEEEFGRTVFGEGNFMILRKHPLDERFVEIFMGDKKRLSDIEMSFGAYMNSLEEKQKAEKNEGE